MQISLGHLNLKGFAVSVNRKQLLELGDRDRFDPLLSSIRGNFSTWGCFSGLKDLHDS